MADAIDGMSDGIDGIGGCHRWHGTMSSMVLIVAIDGMGRCLRWYWALPSLAWDDAIDGIEHGHEWRVAQA